VHNPENTHHFPAIQVKRKGNRWQAEVGIALQSILKAALVVSSSRLQGMDGEMSVTINPQEKQFQAQREAFLRALSLWPDYIILEMTLTVLPDLSCKSRSRIEVIFHIKIEDETENQAKEEVLKRYLAFQSLLVSHFPEAEFEPVTDISRLMRPFVPQYGLAVRRRQEQIILTRPWQKRAIGLGPQPEAEEKEGFAVWHLYPWVPACDDWSRLIETLVGQMEPVQLLVRVRRGTLTNDQKETLEETIRKCEQYLSLGESGQLSLRHQVAMIRDETIRSYEMLKDCAFRLGVYLLTPYEIDSSLGAVIGNAITCSPNGMNHAGFLQGGFEVIPVPVDDILSGEADIHNKACTASEAAAAFRIPSPPEGEQTCLPVKRSRTAAALLPESPGEGKEAIDIALNLHQQVRQRVRVGADDRMRHMFLIGQTGTGKSTLMESMILQDIREGRGLAVIDPHGELVDSILGKIPQSRAEDVILFDVLDRERPVGFNILEWSSRDERDLIIDDLYLTIDRIYDMKQTGGPIFESNFRGMLKLLMGDRRHDDFSPTIMEFLNCYLDKNFRNWLCERTNESMVLDFVRELERTGGDASLQNLAPYITSKMGRFIHDRTMMNIFGQEKTGFDFDEIMNQGKIFLVKLGKGRFGQTVSALLANQLVARFKNAAMKRGEMRPEERRDFFLYVDECHNLPSENFTELLSEARKYRMGLVLATQYGAQLESQHGHNGLLQAVLGNVGTIIIYRLGQEDARNLAIALYPTFSATDIVGLPNWQGYIRMQSTSDTVPPFSFKNIRDLTPYQEEMADFIRNLSRHKYGRSVPDIQIMMDRRRTLWKEDSNS
jgi:DNA helicase HerA-like ATPase